VFPGRQVGRVAHGVVLVHFPEAVLLEAVHELAVTVLVAKAGFFDVVGHVGHAFHAAGHHHVVDAEHDALGAEHDGFGARGAHLVDGGADHVVGQAGVQGGLAGGGLAEVGRQHVAHEYFLDFLRVYPGPGQGALDGLRSQLGGRKSGQYPAKAANGRAYGGHYNYFFHIG
jgi:hypothetical protein